VTGLLSCYRRSMSTTTGLDGLLEPLSRCLDGESMQRLLAFRVDPAVQAPIDMLNERANEGNLSIAERAEYESLIKRRTLFQSLSLKPASIWTIRFRIDSRMDGARR
jgi:hypothetical protein